MDDEVHVAEGMDKGRVVNDQGQAYELAYLEANKGRGAAAVREKELAEGLTDGEKENLRAVENLPGMFPNAFIPDVDGTPIRTDTVTGRPYLVVAPSLTDEEFWVIGQKGVARLGLRGMDPLAFARSGVDLDWILSEVIKNLDKPSFEKPGSFSLTGWQDNEKYSLRFGGLAWRTVREAVEVGTLKQEIQISSEQYKGKWGTGKKEVRDILEMFST